MGQEYQTAGGDRTATLLMKVKNHEWPLVWKYKNKHSGIETVRHTNEEGISDLSEGWRILRAPETYEVYVYRNKHSGGITLKPRKVIGAEFKRRWVLVAAGSVKEGSFTEPRD